MPRGTGKDIFERRALGSSGAQQLSVARFQPRTGSGRGPGSRRPPMNSADSRTRLRRRSVERARGATMSGPKIVRVVTREELQAEGLMRLRTVDAALAQCERTARRYDAWTHERSRALAA